VVGVSGSHRFFALLRIVWLVIAKAYNSSLSEFYYFNILKEE